eukprot:TRINITY_DN2724_c0_g1_i4.p1 TRINITY_DN2724_c0_g1~~TRINITY_DN2724_c0_g1_i4.p1  ORF type:complete len:484 (+),score=140.25 TRINITY_DN2724_c0_g1_i4:995-2446(+)
MRLNSKNEQQILDALASQRLLPRTSSDRSLSEAEERRRTGSASQAASPQRRQASRIGKHEANGISNGPSSKASLSALRSHLVADEMTDDDAQEIIADAWRDFAAKPAAAKEAAREAYREAVASSSKPKPDITRRAYSQAASWDDDEDNAPVSAATRISQSRFNDDWSSQLAAFDSPLRRMHHTSADDDQLIASLPRSVAMIVMPNMRAPSQGPAFRTALKNAGIIGSLPSASHHGRARSRGKQSAKKVAKLSEEAAQKLMARLHAMQQQADQRRSKRHNPQTAASVIQRAYRNHLHRRLMKALMAAVFIQRWWREMRSKRRRARRALKKAALLLVKMRSEEQKRGNKQSSKTGVVRIRPGLQGVVVYERDEGLARFESRVKSTLGRLGDAQRPSNARRRSSRHLHHHSDSKAAPASLDRGDQGLWDSAPASSSRPSARRAASQPALNAPKVTAPAAPVAKDDLDAEFDLVLASSELYAAFGGD